MVKEDIDKVINEVQKEVVKQENAEYNEYIVKLLHHPRNRGIPAAEEISVSQSYTGPCGDTMQFFLKINNGVIEKANFITNGCGASIATASQTTLLIEDKSLDFAEKLRPEDIDKALHGLPEDHKHCAELAVRTLKRAIKKYKDKT